MAVVVRAVRGRSIGATFHSSATVGRTTADHRDEREPPQLEPFDTTE
jgi:hypothetical protein